MQFEPTRAIYSQIADFICEKILKKEWAVSVRIPSIRELAVMIEVNPNTVVRAYGYLEEQHIINKQRGIGYFVTDDAIDKIQTLKRAHFYKQDLPKFLKQLDLLGLTLDDLKKGLGQSS